MSLYIYGDFIINSAKSYLCLSALSPFGFFRGVLNTNKKIVISTYAYHRQLNRKIEQSKNFTFQVFYGDLVYKFKKLIGSNDFSFQFRKIITRYRRIGYNLNVMRQSACLVLTQSRLITMLPSLIARRWVGRQTL